MGSFCRNNYCRYGRGLLASWGCTTRIHSSGRFSSQLYKESHPHTQIIFRTKSSRGIEQLVLQSRAEIGVITNPSNSRLLRLLPCREENIVVIVSAKHPLAKKFELNLAEVAQAPLIIKKGGQGRPSEFLRQIESQGFRLNILMECESGQAIKIA